MSIDILQKWFDEKILTKEQNGKVYMKMTDSDRNTNTLYLRKTNSKGYTKYKLSYLGNPNQKVFLYEAKADDGTFYKFSHPYGKNEFYVCPGGGKAQLIDKVYKPMMSRHGYAVHLANENSAPMECSALQLKL